MKRNNLWVLLSVVLSMLLAMSPAGCKKSNEPSSENSNKSSLQTGSESPPDDPRRELPELSDHAKDFAEKRERVRQGETVDFWGDGTQSRVWFDEKGVRYMESNGPPHKPYRYTSETWPDGSKITRFYENADDGIIDRQIEKTPGKEIQLYDRNRAGFFNEELTLITLESGMIHHILKKRTSATEEWKVVKDSVIPPAHGVPPPGLLENFERFKKKEPMSR